MCALDGFLLYGRLWAWQPAETTLRFARSPKTSCKISQRSYGQTGGFG